MTQPTSLLKKTIAYFYINIKFRRHIKILRSLKKRNIDNYSSNSDYQLEKLSVLLQMVSSNIGYYKKMDINLKGGKISYSDFQKIPVMTKDMIRNNSDKLLNLNFRNMQQVFKNTSGGSTGEPLTFFRTKEQAIHGLANYYLALVLNGVNIYDVSVDFWGAERDMYNTQKGVDFKSFIKNKVTFNTFVLSDEIVKQYISYLNLIKPKFIKAYVHSIYEISQFINKNNIKIYFTPIIHCTTGPLYPEMKVEIQSAFNDAKVYNFYGSREVSSIATEVLGKEGMFVLFDNVLIEILDDQDQPVKKGEEGEVVVTTLNNFYMPLIRYKIGDRAVKGDDLVFGSLRLEKVSGRTLGVIYKDDGTKIDGQFFTTLFFNKKGIKSFQLVQKSIYNLDLYIIKGDHFERGEVVDIVERIKSELPNANISVLFVNTINLTSTGKIMYVYSEIKS